MKILKLVFFVGLFFWANAVAAQSQKLARQYYNTGEFEKAGEIYEQLYNKSKNSTYFSYYIKCLTAVEDYDKAEKVIKKEIKRNSRPDIYVIYGDLFELKSEMAKAEEQYELAIASLDRKPNNITSLANAFRRSSKYDLAAKVYERAEELLGKENAYSYNLADLYKRKGDTDKMLEKYLDAIEYNPRQLNSVRNVLSRELRGDGFDALKTKLYGRIQNNPDLVELPELLLWVHTQNKDYNQAMRQAKALDLRLGEEGNRIYDLAVIASNARDYDTAIDGFDYIVENKPMSPLIMNAKEASLSNKRKRITRNYDYSIEDLKELEGEYEAFLEEKGKNVSTAFLIANYAELEALYLNDLDKAIKILNELIEIRGINKYVLNNAKLDLGDYYLMKSEIWDATLLYSQVDKELKEAYLGEQARFRNAKLSYYNGDFEWAQSQFDILKASTSKLISNDAIDLSVFITDNLGLDSTAYPMELYARAELLAFQNKYQESFVTLDSISTLFPDHGLKDDIMYTKALAYVKLKEYDKAVDLYSSIFEEFPDEIRADNAIFNLAELYENQLENQEEAQKLYEKLFLDYSNSTFAIEARKRYRLLRGDNVN
jgi:tetratricopeptide (TPR) repeat protein